MNAQEPLSPHEAIFNVINSVWRDPALSFTAANEVLDQLAAAGYVVVLSIKGAADALAAERETP